ncbi:MAG: nucleotidyltransferase [Bacilli bacterium]|uniref:nucleotidyltransferase domain-containing protein n=1 Tax=Sulfurimonas sp. TaxID=2022749 RepID=UPI0025E1A33E|nr:nucleotidyltransferase [Sulfurimonas sp.]MCK9454834.1 nucleotidyltransferase [Sulfurimonas sp.]
MTKQQETLILENIVELLELPDTAYKKAKERYEDLGEWFGRDESLFKDNDVHVFPQGSFRLGTAIRPLNNNEEYDLDLACNIRDGISKSTHSQKDLKELVGKELESYRNTRGIKSKKDEKRRCWRLEYQDSLSFHIDVVPCIPLDESISNLIYKDIYGNYVSDENLSRKISSKSVSITDTDKKNYPKIDSDWNISNPEGYALWFEAMMQKNQATRLLMEKAQVDKLPSFNQKTILQRAVQLLKRHRDNMFKDNDDSKPISVIITTLAGRAYNGEENLVDALKNILDNMDKYINKSGKKVPNPTHPEEDFADKWDDASYTHLKLEENFYLWLKSARRDFASMTGSDNGGFDSDLISEKMSLSLNSIDKIGTMLGLAASSAFSNNYHIKKEDTASPWRKS